MKKYLLNTLLLSFLISISTACSNASENLSTSKYKKNISSKNIYLEKANNNDIEAMIELNKHYDFLYSKEGLEQYEKWYKKISTSEDIELINKFVKIMIENHDYFLNYEYKISNLLEKLPNDTSKYLSTKLEFYFKIQNLEEEDSLLHEAFNNLSQKELHKLTNFYANHKENLNDEQFKKLQKLVKNKSYKVPNLLHHYRITSYKIKEEKRKANLKKVLNLDEKTILQLARIAVKKSNLREAIKLYQKAIELGTEDKEAYYFIATNTRNLYKKEQKEKAVNYYKKAMNLGHKKAAATLLKIYSEDKQYLDKYLALKKKYESDDETLLLYVNELLQRPQFKRVKGILEELEKRGNQEALLLLVFEPRLYRYNVEETIKAKQYEEKILNSNDSQLLIKYYEKMKKPRYSYKFQKELENHLVNEAKKGNLKGIRHLLKYTRIPKEQKAKWLKKAYKLGDNKAAYHLAEDHRYSHGLVEKSKTKQKEIYEDLASKNDIRAMLYLASFYGIKDKKNMKYWYEQAAKFNDTIAFRNLAAYYTCKPCRDNKEPDYNKALKYIQHLANKKSSSHMYTLGWLYQSGLAGLQKDYKKAIYWYKKAGAKNNKTALRNLGLLYKEGNNQVAKDLEKAIFYLKKADEEYSRDAANDLGDIYQAKKDYKNAIFWYTKGTKEYNKTSFYNLGLLYELGLGVKKDIPKALSYYKESGSEEAKKRIQKLKL